MKRFWRKFVDNLGTERDEAPTAALEELGRVVPDATRCVQCGICGYNCPAGIPVRDYARQGLPVSDPACLTCGNCIAVCPRGTLRWETAVHPLVSTYFASNEGRTA